jgi:Domain of unknown function (DUF4266)
MLSGLTRVGLRRWLCLLLVVVASGCATTKVWEHGDLARSVMDVRGDDGLDTLHEHLLGIREGAVGGLGGGGGGCGCN